MSLFYSTSSVKIGGSEYKPLAILAIKPATDFENPSFGEIKDILIIDNGIYFYVHTLDIIEYSEHYCAFITHRLTGHPLALWLNM